ncbi:MAG: NUDIX domain-containing protein [Planctomycetota bacterium]|nr:MAG: NUDIX domain-containing protein [Planctomycetota bacterium]
MASFKPLPEVRACGMLVVIGQPVERFLLMRHKDRWDLPKGHVDPGETDLETAWRELSEETGIPLEAVDLDPFFRFEHKYAVREARSAGELRMKTLVIFLARLNREVSIEVSEHPGYQWFEWRPPHRIQEQTIDPLLAAMARYIGK